MEKIVFPSTASKEAERSSIVHSETLFQDQDVLPSPLLPQFTKAELLDLGVKFSETELTRSCTIPLSAQRKMVESVKTFGFGSSDALRALIQNAIAVLGFVGQAKFAVQQDTFAWNAWQDKRQPPKEEGGDTSPVTSPPSGSLQQFESGAVRDANVAGAKGGFPARYDLVSPIALRRIAETYGEGAQKYNDHNWRKGMPISSCVNHAFAHLIAYMMGDGSEDHAAHCCWNLMAIMHFQETQPELFDLKIDDYKA